MSSFYKIKVAGQTPSREDVDGSIRAAEAYDNYRQLEHICEGSPGKIQVCNRWVEPQYSGLPAAELTIAFLTPLNNEPVLHARFQKVWDQLKKTAEVAVEDPNTGAPVALPL